MSKGDGEELKIRLIPPQEPNPLTPEQAVTEMLTEGCVYVLTKSDGTREYFSARDTWSKP